MFSFDFKAPQRVDLDGEEEGGMMQEPGLPAVITSDHFFVENESERGELPPVEDLISTLILDDKQPNKSKLRDSTNKPTTIAAHAKRQIPITLVAEDVTPVAIEQQQQPVATTASPNVDPRVPPRRSVLQRPTTTAAPVTRSVTRSVTAAVRQPSPRTAALAMPRQPSPRTVQLAAPRQPSPRTAALAAPRQPLPRVSTAAPRSRTPPPPAAAVTRQVLQPALVSATPAAASSFLLPTQHQYQVKTQAQVYGRSNTPGYLTPTEASKSSFRNKFTPPRAPTPPPVGSTSRASSPMPLTTPKTPHLATRELRRNNNAGPLDRLVTSEDLELERIAREKQELIKRKETERQRVQRASLNPVRPAPPVTEPKPFHLRVDSRLGMKVPAPQTYKSAMEISSQVMSRESKCWVEPQLNPAALSANVKPFNLLSDTRLRGSAYKPTEEMELDRVQQETAEEQHLRQLRDQQRFEIQVCSTTTQHEKRPATQPEPFHLESVALHARAQQQLEERIQRERQEEQERRKFHALPYQPGGAVTTFSSSSAHVAPPALTNPKAPSFVGRALKMEQIRKQRLQQEQREKDKANQSNFRARVLPKTTYERGFVPEPSHVPLVDPKTPRLHSQTRYVERTEYDLKRREMEEEEERQQKLREEENARKEQEALKEHRKSLVHHARPVPATSRFSHAPAAAAVQFGGNHAIPDHDEDHLQQEDGDEPIARRLRSSLGGSAVRKAIATAIDEQE